MLAEHQQWVVSLRSSGSLLKVLTPEFLLDVYVPWDQLLVPVNELRGAPLKRYFNTFLESIPARVAAWEMVATEAELSFERDSVEFAMVGWRLVKDGYAAELASGGSGGTWICLAWDWAVHLCEILRKHYDLTWKIRPGGKWFDAGRPYLGGIPNVHKDYGFSIIHSALDQVQFPDFLPTMPAALFESCERLCHGNEIDLFHLSSLALPDTKLSYLADKPPVPTTLTKADFFRHPRRESWEQYLRTGEIIDV
jgi:hypothetical protein